ncbi:UDP binding domain-containing protein [Streptomyces bobili]|uniref:UDP binding domain-containing protein n=1 Tax=Streptomyces bobili TaxID=67280 RepID=UPI0033A82D55
MTTTTQTTTAQTSGTATPQAFRDAMAAVAAINGPAFKPNTDDIRDSPALAVAQKLHELGAEVTVTDPQALDNARKAQPDLDYVDYPIAAVQDADLLVHLTEWPQFEGLVPGWLAALTGPGDRLESHPPHHIGAREIT